MSSTATVPRRAASPSAVPVVWVVALAFAASLHLAALALFWWRAQDEDDADAFGAPAIAVSLDLTAPREADDTLPPGALAEASMASTAAAEQHQKVEKIEAPKEQPKESEDPDRLVAPDVPKEQKDAPSKLETKAQAASDSVASEASAPPRIEIAKESPRSTAPSPGTGVSAERVLMIWQKMLVAHVNRYKRFPASDRHKTVHVVVTVRVSLDRLGRVLDARIQSGSGDALIDQAALDMMHRADPVPPPPPLVADGGLTFLIPVTFNK